MVGGGGSEEGEEDEEERLRGKRRGGLYGEGECRRKEKGGGRAAVSGIRCRLLLNCGPSRRGGGTGKMASHIKSPTGPYLWDVFLSCRKGGGLEYDYCLAVYLALTEKSL